MSKQDKRKAWINRIQDEELRKKLMKKMEENEDVDEIEDGDDSVVDEELDGWPDEEEREAEGRTSPQERRCDWDTAVDTSLNLFVAAMRQATLREEHIGEVSERIRYLMQKYPETWKPDSQGKMCKIRELKLLRAAREEYLDQHTSERLAEYKRAYHRLMRRIWEKIDETMVPTVSVENRLAVASQKYREFREEVKAVVAGQNAAVDAFAMAGMNSEIALPGENHPQAAFLFAGPPGVGKTFLAQTAAKAMGRPFKRFDMSSYATDKSELGLIGSETLFKDPMEGTLVSYVEDHPDAVLLFDEIEKAHPDVIKLFLSVLDGARLENKMLSTQTDFSRTMVIFTTNAGRALYENTRHSISGTPTDVVIEALKKEGAEQGRQAFPPEMCSRLASQNIVMFDRLGIEDMLRLVSGRMEKVQKELVLSTGVLVNWDKRLPMLLLLHEGRADVRMATAKAEQFLRKTVFDLAEDLAGMKVGKRVKQVVIGIDADPKSEQERKFLDLFNKDSTPAPKNLLQKRFDALVGRNKVFGFETRVELPKRRVKADTAGTPTIRVILSDLTIRDAVHTDDRDLLVAIEERPTTRFEDVIGAENAKRELRDFGRFLTDPEDYRKSALNVPKGILLYGPPGTGKTMLARAMAGETDATFLSISASNLIASYLGEGEERLKKLFATARKYAPAIIFVDEVDAIAKERIGGVYGSANESVLNQFLTEMDGFAQNEDAPVYVIAATNFPVESDNPLMGKLDAAFTRRFANRIEVDLPTKQEREEFLKKRVFAEDGGEKGQRHGAKASRKVGERRGAEAGAEPMPGSAIPEHDITLAGVQALAARTPGESLAVLENILELAFRSAAGRGVKPSDELLDEAMHEYFYGEKRPEPDEQQLMQTAIHEAAHAYVCAKSGRSPEYLTVVNRGNYGGYMQPEEQENRQHYTREEFLWKIRVALAGRGGEKLFYGEEAAMNTGAASDLRKASGLVMSMLTEFGMCDGHLFCPQVEDLQKSPAYPEYVQQAEQILQEQALVCEKLLAEGRETIERVARTLVEKNHLGREELAELLRA